MLICQSDNAPVLRIWKQNVCVCVGRACLPIASVIAVHFEGPAIFSADHHHHDSTRKRVLPRTPYDSMKSGMQDL